MRNKPMFTRPLLTALAAFIALAAAACGPKKPEPTPTMSVDAIYTAAVHTLMAQQATQKALTPPTPAATETTFPTLAPAPSLPPAPLFGTATASLGGGGVPGCDNAVFVADVTIPDGSEMPAGKKFIKTWSLLNKGSCEWSTSYKLAFLNGDQMSGTDAFVPQSVPVGSVINMSVNLVAPEAAGSYTGNWQMENAASQRFGNIITVVIKVGAATNTPGGPTNTPLPTHTPKPTSKP
jgi:hypothetical protein